MSENNLNNQDSQTENNITIKDKENSKKNKKNIIIFAIIILLLIVLSFIFSLAFGMQIRVQFCRSAIPSDSCLSLLTIAANLTKRLEE